MIRSASAKKLLTSVLFAACIGCKNNETTWRSQSKSPNGQWIAIAHTENTAGGFGTGAQWTTVELKQSFAGAKPVEVLVIDEGPVDISNLKMMWPTLSYIFLIVAAKKYSSRR
jgi:hypothetical protein